MARPATLCSLIVLLASAGGGAQVAVPAPGEVPRPEFSAFVATLKEQALAAGISAQA